LTAEAAGPTVVISVPQPITASSLPITVQTPTGPVIIIPDYRSGGVSAVVTPGAK
jgi:hypothetical protein